MLRNLSTDQLARPEFASCPAGLTAECPVCVAHHCAPQAVLQRFISSFCAVFTEYGGNYETSNPDPDSSLIQTPCGWGTSAVAPFNLIDFLTERQNPGGRKPVVGQLNPGVATGVLIFASRHTMLSLPREQQNCKQRTSQQPTAEQLSPTRGKAGADFR